MIRTIRFAKGPYKCSKISGKLVYITTCFREQNNVFGKAVKVSTVRKRGWQEYNFNWGMGELTTNGRTAGYPCREGWRQVFGKVTTVWVKKDGEDKTTIAKVW